MLSNYNSALYDESSTKSNSRNEPTESKPGPEVIKLFSSSTQLSIKFKQLINDKIVQIKKNFRFRSPEHVIYPADEC